MLYLACRWDRIPLVPNRFQARENLLLMMVRVEVFGRAATQSGERALEVEVPAGASLRDVAAAVTGRFPQLEWIAQACRPARNLEYAQWSDLVAEGDEVSFIPPVSGG